MKGKTYRGIIIVLFILFIIITIYTFRVLIKPIFLSFLLAYILNPVVKFLEKRGFKKRWAVLTCLGILALFFLWLIFLIIPGLIRDLMGLIGGAGEDFLLKYLKESNIFKYSPDYLKGVIESSIIKLEVYFESYINQSFKGVMAFLNILPVYSVVPLFIYYFLVDAGYFVSILKSLIPLRIREDVIQLFREIDIVIGSYVRGQVFLSLIIAVLTFFSLLIFKVKYPVVIAVVNGITNVIPYFGPVIGLLPAFLAGLTDSMEKALFVSISLFLVQEFEGDVVAPKIIGDSTGIHPVFIIALLILGGKYFGGWGLVLAVPAFGALKVIYGFLMRKLYL